MMLVPRRPKIPGNCVVCGEPLNVTAMHDWLRACENSGRDPVESAPRGISCTRCVARRMTDLAEMDDDEFDSDVERAAAAKVRKTIHARRVDARGGLRVVGE